MLDFLKLKFKWFNFFLKCLYWFSNLKVFLKCVLKMCLNYNTWTNRSISIIGRALLVSHNSSAVVPKKPQEKAIELFNLAVQKQYTFLISSLFSSLDFFSLYFLRQAKGSISLKHPPEGRRRRRRRNQPTLHHTQSTIVENCGWGKKNRKGFRSQQWIHSVPEAAPKGTHAVVPRFLYGHRNSQRPANPAGIVALTGSWGTWGHGSGLLGLSTWLDSGKF